MKIQRRGKPQLKKNQKSKNQQSEIQFESKGNNLTIQLFNNF